MNSRAVSIAIAGGLAAGVLFIFGMTIKLGSMLFFYASLLPFFLVGFAAGKRAALVSGGIALVIALLLGGPVAPIMLGVLQLLPALYALHHFMLWRENERGREWYPVGWVLSHLTAAGALLFLFIALYFHGRDGGLAGIAAESITRQMKTMDTEVSAQMQQIVQHLPSLLFALTAWLWVLMIYLHAWLAHFFLSGKMALEPPRLPLLPFAPPGWLLATLVVSATASLLLSGETQFIATTITIILLLPYGLSGMALIHLQSQSWPARILILSVFYFMLLALPLLVMIPVVMGLFHQYRRFTVTPEKPEV